MTYCRIEPYEKQQARLQKLLQEALSDEEDGNLFGETSSDEYEPPESAESDSDLEVSHPQRKKRKTGRSVPSDLEASTSSAGAQNTENDCVRQTIEDVIKNMTLEEEEVTENQHDEDTSTTTDFAVGSCHWKLYEKN